MDKNLEAVRRAQVERTIKALAQNRIPAVYAPTREEAVEAVRGMLSPGEVVTCGGSMTLAECGIQDLLKSGAYEFLDRTVMDPQEVYRRTFSADVFLTSANAITEEGELYNVDGNGNRVAALIYGPAGDCGGRCEQDCPQPGGGHFPGEVCGSPGQRRALGHQYPLLPHRPLRPVRGGHDRRLRLGKADVLPVCGHRLPAHRPHPGGAGRGGAGLLKPHRTGSLWARRTQKCEGRAHGGLCSFPC